MGVQYNIRLDKSCGIQKSSCNVITKLVNKLQWHVLHKKKTKKAKKKGKKKDQKGFQSQKIAQ